MSDQDPLVSGTIRRRVDAFTGSDHYRFTIDGIEYDAHWAHDTRRLLDENARLNAERERYLHVNEQLKHEQDTASARLFDAGVESVPLSAGVEELTSARGKARAELDRVTREATADKAKLATVTAELTAVWELLDGGVRHDCLSPNHNDPCHRRAANVLREAFRTALTAAPEMPRPPAQERAGDTNTSPAGSGRGTGVTEAPGTQETERHWLKFNNNREITGCSCGFKADLDSDCGWGDSVVAHLIAVGHAEEAAALKESIRLDRAPSLPVPSTEEQ